MVNWCNGLIKESPPGAMVSACSQDVAVLISSKELHDFLAP
jgi:hypothetical protein